MSGTWRAQAQTTGSPDVEQRIDLTAADSPGKPDIVELDDDSISTDDPSELVLIRSAAKQGGARPANLLTSSDDEEGTGGAIQSLPNSWDATKQGKLSATKLGTTNTSGTKPGAGPEADSLMGTRPPSAGALLTPKSPSKVTPWAAFAQGKPSSGGFMVVARGASVAAQAGVNKPVQSERQGTAQPSASPQAKSAPAKPAVHLPGAGLKGSKPSLSTDAADLHAANGSPVGRNEAVATAQAAKSGLGDEQAPRDKVTSPATSEPNQAASMAANRQEPVSTGGSIPPEGSAKPTAIGTSAATVPARALPYLTKSPQPKDPERVSAAAPSAAAFPPHASPQPGKPLQPAGSGGISVEVGAAPSASRAAPSVTVPLPSAGLGPVSGLGGSNLVRRHKAPRKQQASSQPSGGASASLMESNPVRTLPQPSVALSKRSCLKYEQVWRTRCPEIGSMHFEVWGIRARL